MKNFESICVVGLGYIGLPTATVLSLGCRVLGVDTNPDVVRTINSGSVHIAEPGLSERVASAVNAGKLSASVRPEPADAFVIAVPTPFTASKLPDLRHVEAATASIAPILKSGDLIVLESTVPVGATEQLGAQLAELRPDLKMPAFGESAGDVFIAHCPERVLPGRMLSEIVNNDRIIGGITRACSERATELYKKFVIGACITTDARTAELCKLAENAYRDVNIAYANELSMISDRLSIDVWELIRLANRHPRVNILQPGAGVGGHCIAVDPWFIVSVAPHESRLVRMAREVNDIKPDWVIQKVTSAVSNFRQAHSREAKIAVLGLAFKPDIEDLRESPAVHITQRLHGMYGGHLIVVEPHIAEMPGALYSCQLVNLNEAIAAADILVVLVAHSAFRVALGALAENTLTVLDFTGITSLLAAPSNSRKQG